MPRISTLESRRRQLQELKEYLSSFNNREAEIDRLKHQLHEAERMGFPESAQKAIRAEMRSLERLTPDIPTVERKIDILSRWITVESEYQSVFKPPRRTGGTGKKRGRPPKKKD